MHTAWCEIIEHMHTARCEIIEHMYTAQCEIIQHMHTAQCEIIEHMHTVWLTHQPFVCPCQATVLHENFDNLSLTGK